MYDTIKTVCENNGCTVEAVMGTTLDELKKTLGEGNRYPFLAAYVNNRIKELHYKIYTPVTVRFIDITDAEGYRVYQRTLSFIAQKAVADVFPRHTFHLRHAVGNGYYCEAEGIEEFSAADAARLKARISEIVACDMPIERRRMPTDEVRKAYAAQGFDDKIALLDTRPRLYSDMYTLDDTVGYFYGALAPSTGYITLFDVTPFYNGFYLSLPKRDEPSRLDRLPHLQKLFDIFCEYRSWTDIMGVPTVGRLNSKILNGESGDMIKVAEAFHEKNIAHIADMIYAARVQRGVKFVFIAGPSSSGKTTSAKRLGIQLRILGLKPETISIDDYFVDRERTPLDADGNYDFEALEAIDLPLFNRHLASLAAGERVLLPRYDFITGRSLKDQQPLQLSDNSILVIEGIHGLNPRLTSAIKRSDKFCIYISCFTSVAMDNVSRISTSDNRMLRRMLRDYYTRGNDARATISRWGSVRRGEDLHIFPYQENADVMFNSSLFYEISVLRPLVEPILREVPDTVPEYAEAVRLLKFLDNFTPVKPDEIPPTSILREFVGGSSFK